MGQIKISITHILLVSTESLKSLFQSLCRAGARSVALSYGICLQLVDLWRERERERV
jgi:hypothetical protein